jgi:hypothetical protein
MRGHAAQKMRQRAPGGYRALRSVFCVGVPVFVRYLSFTHIHTPMAYQKNPNLIDKKTDTGLLLFDTDSSRMVELNSTAMLLWQESKSSFTEKDLQSIIESRCTGAKNVEQDISDFIKTALKLNLVTENGKD